LSQTRGKTSATLLLTQKITWLQQNSDGSIFIKVYRSSNPKDLGAGELLLLRLFLVLHIPAHFDGSKAFDLFNGKTFGFVVDRTESHQTVAKLLGHFLLELLI
jgi:hypothetical protein